ncbi:MAG: hypothetical protein SFY80_14880 [Verrucomicrobiota bacterium]|nr:hypothetical protein [Verrucomicrobiota bacterium]
MKMGAFVLAYHGCDKSVGEALIAGSTSFKASQNDYDWLGHGIYLWENNPKRAMDWAKFMAAHPTFRKRVKEPYAVGAIVDLGNCLDLTESHSLEMVSAGYDSLKAIFALDQQSLPENKQGDAGDVDLIRRNLDCAVINHVHDLRKKANMPTYDTVRGAFHEGEALYPGAGIKRKTQIAVRTLSNIVGVFKIRGL